MSGLRQIGADVRSFTRLSPPPRITAGENITRHDRLWPVPATAAQTASRHRRQPSPPPDAASRHHRPSPTAVTAVRRRRPSQPAAFTAASRRRRKQSLPPAVTATGTEAKQPEHTAELAQREWAFQLPSMLVCGDCAVTPRRDRRARKIKYARRRRLRVFPLRAGDKRMESAIGP